MRRITVFTNRYPLVGPLFWIMSAQYMAMQAIIASTWHNPSYSWLHNAISDLGATLCGPYSGRMVCSPYFNFMNASFVLLGFTMIAGSVLIYQKFAKTRGSRLGFSMMALGGLGVILVGLFPENEVPVMHAIGAVPAFVAGDAAMIVFGLSLGLGKKMRLYSIASGVIALSAFVLYVTHHYLGLGEGTMERLAGYPQTFWLIAFGVYMSRPHFARHGRSAEVSPQTKSH